MILALAAAAALSFAEASPTPTATPLRHIAYKFSYHHKATRTFEDFGAPPEEAGTSGGFNGTISIDVIAVGDDGGMGANVTDQNDALNGKVPDTALFVIQSDGAYSVKSGTYDDVMTAIVPYLATAYFEGHDLTKGNTWQTIGDSPGVHTTTEYTVADASGDTATITSTMTGKGSGLNGTLTVEARLVYKASLLVPLSLDIIITRASSGTASNGDEETHYHFDRVADSRDSGS